MHSKSCTARVCALLAAVISCPGVLAEEPTSTPHLPKAPDGWVLIDEAVWEVVPDTTVRHLHDAQQAFTGRRYEEAVSEIRQAAAVMLFCGRKENEVAIKEALMEAVLDLERLAHNIEKHTTFRRTSMNPTFARAECALARHDIRRARYEWTKGRRDMARLGTALGAAATHVFGGYLWSGKEMDAHAIDAVSRADHAAAMLEAGHFVDGKQVQAVMEGLETYIKQLALVVETLPRVPVGASAERGAAPLPAPEGYVLVEDDVWFAYIDEPGQLFHKARADYTNSNPAMASADLREASIHLRIDAHRVDDSAIREALAASASDLERLAKDVELNHPIAPSRFAHVFAKAHHDLARANHWMATDAWATKNTQRARQALRAAWTNVKQGFVWRGLQTQASSVDVSLNVESLCARMAKNVGWEDKEFEGAVAFVAAQIRQLGKDL